MAGKIARKTLNELNELRWSLTAENNLYEIGDELVLKPRPEGVVWFAWTGHEEGKKLAAALRNSPAKIAASLDFVGDVFGVSVPPSQIQALADNGVDFAQKALRNPDLRRIEPAVRSLG